MSFLCSSTSTSGSIIPLLATRAPLPFLYPVDLFYSFYCRRPRLRRQSSTAFETAKLEAWFIKSLVLSGQCQKHRPRPSPSRTTTSPQGTAAELKTRAIYNICFHRQQHTDSARNFGEVDNEEPNRTKEELMDLVDQYSSYSYTDQLPLLELPNLNQGGGNLRHMVSDKADDPLPRPHSTWPADSETKTKLRELEDALQDFAKDPEEIFQLYRQLPSPRAPYLESKTRHRLLRHLSVVERKDEQSMLRYFSVVDDVKQNGISLSTSEWTSALSFAARYVARSTEVEVEAALVMWREMEHIAGVRGNDATFNVLFDVACKAGKFTLAEMIYKEMVARGFQYNRFHHVSLIHYHGLRGDGDSVRAAYKALVEAGEIVDTVVLNAMISGLISAHEAQAAENIYERMKDAHLARSALRLPPRDYKARRQINKVLMKMARVTAASVLAEFQRKSIIAPDPQTYRILVYYSAVRAGDLEKTARYLDEMKWFKLPLNGALFLSVLKGFAVHGGIRYTEWTEERLESVWKAFLQATRNGIDDLYISKWMVAWALKAFAKCSGKARTLSVWTEVKEIWKPSELELDFLMHTLRSLLDGADMAGQNHDWILGTG